MAEPERTQIGKYRLVRAIGQGAMGIVYLAHDPHLDRHVAIKVIRKDVIERREADQVMARFRNEAMAAGRLQHPGIVAVHDYGEDESTSFIVMEYAPGDDLEEYARKYAPLPLSDATGLMAQLLDALHWAHSYGVIHRDIKPSNLVVTGGRLKVTDFGIARISSAKLTQTGVAMGTPMYMSPEQYIGTGIDQRSDLFSAAVVFYEMLAGVRPFEGESIHSLAYKICHVDPVPPSRHGRALPPALDAVVMKGLAKDRAARWSTGHEFAMAINAALTGLTGAVPASTVTVPTTARVSAEDLDRASQALAAYVGPIARVLVKKTAPAASDFTDLCARLLEHLGSDKERVEFLKKLGVR